MSNDSYREQLDRLVAAMSVANQEDQVAESLRESEPSRVKMFVDGNLDKRFEKIQKGLELLQEDFEKFDDLIIRYMKEVPLAAYDTGASDADRMLIWMSETMDLDAEQRDLVKCQRARHAVEDRARLNRMQHVRFQELRTHNEQLLNEWGVNQELRVHLNPIRVWTTFETNLLLDEEAEPPCKVLFFAVDSDVATAVLEEEGQLLIEELAEFQPCTLEEWIVRSAEGSREELEELTTDLAEMGLVAFR